MGKNTNQIATWEDLNALRLSANFVTSDEKNHCPTKTEIENIDLFKVKQVAGSSYNIAALNFNSSFDVDIPRISVTSNNTLHYTFKHEQYYGTVLFKSDYSQYLYSNSSVNIQFDTSWGGYGSMMSYLSSFYSLKKDETISSSYIGKTCEMGITLNPSIGIGVSTSLDTTYTSMYNYNTRCSILIVYTNGSYTQTELQWGMNDTYNTFLFKPETSTFTIYIIPTEISANIMVSEPGYWYLGFGFTIPNIVITPYTSYYESNQLVKYSDISTSNRSFTIFFGIYNAKSSTAKLDNVKVYLSTRDDTYPNGSWTEIGTTSVGNVSTYKRGSVTCTIPSNFDVTQPLYLCVRCGDTALNQTWYRGEGNITPESNLSSISYSLVSSNGRKYGFYSSRLQPQYSFSSAILNGNGNTGGTRWRSYSKAVCFKIA
jgi:hypothetical protein